VLIGAVRWRFGVRLGTWIRGFGGGRPGRPVLATELLEDRGGSRAQLLRVRHNLHLRSRHGVEASTLLHTHPVSRETRLRGALLSACYRSSWRSGGWHFRRGRGLVCVVVGCLGAAPPPAALCATAWGASAGSIRRPHVAVPAPGRQGRSRAVPADETGRAGEARWPATSRRRHPVEGGTGAGRSRRAASVDGRPPPPRRSPVITLPASCGAGASPARPGPVGGERRRRRGRRQGPHSVAPALSSSSVDTLGGRPCHQVDARFGHRPSSWTVALTLLREADRGPEELGAGHGWCGTVALTCWWEVTGGRGSRGARASVVLICRVEADRRRGRLGVGTHAVGRGMVDLPAEGVARRPPRGRHRGARLRVPLRSPAPGQPRRAKWSAGRSFIRRHVPPGFSPGVGDRVGRSVKGGAGAAHWRSKGFRGGLAWLPACVGARAEVKGSFGRAAVPEDRLPPGRHLAGLPIPTRNLSAPSYA
jgi:hypothetical protein